ncbi:MULTISPECIES: tail fiber assembly protein [Enterobacteriaceae]|uniref:tail fiber assembly protein n=1 Tax=Enterobacteriaceae TaxID=543 RepID=UPI0012830E15|nr:MULTISPECIES: tail fiber assembly protein [Enterobacteriaceae]ECD9274923.1 tail fiber assembly protein [Salmonella enterica subsp. salamae]EJV7471419.1 tail fiber assembly protein [Escherichia coli]HBD0292098.1 tail fiber assembly protein [Escherichia coli]
MKYFMSDPIALYDSDITSAIPHTAVEISDEQYEMLIHGQENGNIISADSNGAPVLLEPPPPTHEELIAQAETKKSLLRTYTNSEIAWRQDAVDAGIATDEETAALAEWKKYRVLLMRVDTAKPVWPTPPGEQAS